MSDKKWKEQLLRSGVPLEHDVARKLTDLDFYIRPEYEFHRQAEGGEKQFSVDLAAAFYGGTPNRIDYSCELLVECKYRAPGKTILLFEEHDPDGGGTLGVTLAAVDALTPFHLAKQGLYDFERNLPSCYKAVEVHDNDADKNSITAGISQLKYGSAWFVFDNISRSFGEHNDDRHPLFLAKILVTNANLRLVKRDVSVASIHASDSIEDFSNSVEAVILNSNDGPDFKRHVEWISSQADISRYTERAVDIREQLIEAGKKDFGYIDEPTSLLREMAKGGYFLRWLSTQFFVVNYNYLDEFVGRMKQTMKESYKGRTKTNQQRRRSRRIAAQ